MAPLQEQIEELKPAAAEAASRRNCNWKAGWVTDSVHQPAGCCAGVRESGERDFKKIELLSVREEGNRTPANVFVPDEDSHTSSNVADYLAEKKGSKGRRSTIGSCLTPLNPSGRREIRALPGTDAPSCCQPILPLPSGGKHGFRFVVRTAAGRSGRISRSSPDWRNAWSATSRSTFLSVLCC